MKTICSRATATSSNGAGLSGLLEVLRSDTYRDSVAHLEGYDPADCGQLLELDEALGGGTGNAR